MEEKLGDRSCAEFAELLASKAPAPGGGGAAALCGALAVSLCAMSAGLTSGRKKYAGYQGLIDECIASAENIRERFIRLMDLDRENFLPLQRAYSMDRSAPGRDKVIREASLKACEAPLEMLRLCAASAELLRDMDTVGNPMLISDVGCGAALCAGAMESAAMNVFVNTRSLRGDGEAEKIKKEARRLLDENLEPMRELSGRIMERLAE